MLSLSSFAFKSNSPPLRRGQRPVRPRVLLRRVQPQRVRLLQRIARLPQASRHHAVRVHQVQDLFGEEASGHRLNFHMVI